MHQYPVLYSFRRCPYAMRARMALYASNITVELREVSLKNKPQAMLSASAKGTVPVLVLDNNTVLDESLEIMQWASQQTDDSGDGLILMPEGGANKTGIDRLIEQNDTEFKYYLDRYKYFDRHPEKSQGYYLTKALPFLNTLEKTLSKISYINSSKLRFVDAAIMPFVRQFYMVDQQQFKQLPLPKLQIWLEQLLNNKCFINIMEKHPIWNEGDNPTFLKGVKSVHPKKSHS